MDKTSGENLELHRKIGDLGKAIQESLDTTRRELAASRERQRELVAEADDAEAGRDEAVLEAAENETRTESEVLEHALVDLSVIFSEVNTKHINLMVGTVTADKNSYALAHLPADIVGRIHARLGDVRATNYSKAASGVFGQNFDANAFFKANAARISEEQTGA